MAKCFDQDGDKQCPITVTWFVFVLFAGQAMSADHPATAAYRLATFSADVTPPLGHPLLGGTTTPPPAHAIDDALFARGFVLLGGDRPVVLVSIDWCEIRNEAFDRWREVLAEAADTTRERVLVTAIHQHDTPLADLEAQRILDGSRLRGAIIDPVYHERCVQTTAAALREGLTRARRVTHFGTGQAQVDRIASNRRYLGPDGKPKFDRSSMSGGDAVPPEQAWAERDSNLSSWCWIDPGAEKPLKDALRKAIASDLPIR